MECSLAIGIMHSSICAADAHSIFGPMRRRRMRSRLSEQLATATPGTSRATQLLGKALIYDQSLSVNNNLACATCHMPYSGFTGGSSFFNGTTSADPGSVPITNAPVKGGNLAGPNARISSRKPQTYAYAPF